MVLLDIKGVTINFPFEPYQCQRDYMEKVIESLLDGKNALLESPTGTGKTLCLLCATLAWQDYMIAQYGHLEQEVQLNYWNKKKSNNSQKIQQKIVPPIIYSSRTHSQLSQCMKALRGTVYSNRKVAVIGSRDQLCINKTVMEIESHSGKLFGCRSRVKQRTCFYYNNYDKQRETINNEMKGTNRVADIEELMVLGKERKCCPYFLSRDMQESARITFMPYNYLLDSRVRRSNGIQLENCVLLFDEAHNIEQVCEDSASVNVTSTQLALCIEELKHLGEYIYSGTQQSVDLDIGAVALPGDDEAKEETPELESVLFCKTGLIAVESRISDLEITNDSNGLTRPADYITGLMSECDVPANAGDLLDKCVQYVGLATKPELQKIGIRGMEAVGNFIRTIFGDDNNEDAASLDPVHAANQRLASSYRVHIRDVVPPNSDGGGSSNVWQRKGVTKVRTVSFWCLTPGRAISALVARFCVRNVILTSGTLFPADSLKMDMRMEFELELRNGHVINRDQMLVSVCSKGPDNTPLNSSYEFRDSANYTSSLGNTLINLCKLVPRGLLVVFPSYFMMKKCIEKWETSDIYNRLLAQKKLIVEPQDKVKFVTAMAEFESANCDRVNEQGACLLAVARGKVSEGLDLSDHRGRAVVIVGIPYPAMMEPRIKLKMAFLDERLVTHKTGMTGRVWYNQQAYRAVNQALGRVIRHSRDYGAIYLCDERFAYNSARSQLPGWLQPMVKICDNFGAVVKSTVSFFRSAPRLYPPPSLGPKVSSSEQLQPISSYKTDYSGDFFNAGCQSNREDILGKIEPARKVQSFASSLRTTSNEPSIEQIISQYTGENSSSAPKSTFGPPSSVATKTSLFDILDGANSTTAMTTAAIVGVKRPLQSLDSYMNVDSTQQKQQEPSTKKKKYKLVKSKESKDDRTKSNPNVITESPEYLESVNNCLQSPEDLRSYEKAVKLFSQNSDVDLLFGTLQSLFVEYGKARLVVDFCRFLKTEESRSKYGNLCQSLLGLNCSDAPVSTDSKLACVKCGNNPAVTPWLMVPVAVCAAFNAGEESSSQALITAVLDVAN